MWLQSRTYTLEIIYSYFHFYTNLNNLIAMVTFDALIPVRLHGKIENLSVKPGVSEDINKSREDFEFHGSI